MCNISCTLNVFVREETTSEPVLVLTFMMILRARFFLSKQRGVWG